MGLREDKFWEKAPFNIDQIKSFNLYQRDIRWSQILCCEKPMYAAECGIVCRECLRVKAECPRYMLSNGWNLFKLKKEEIVETWKA